MRRGAATRDAGCRRCVRKWSSPDLADVHSRAPPLDTAESKMAGGCVDRLGVPRGGTVTPAVIRRAKMRATLDHLAGNLDVRLAGIVACGLGASAGVFGDTAGLRRIGLMLLGVPVGGQLPDIADHVVDPVVIRGACRNR